MDYKTFEVNEEGYTALEAFLKSRPKWRPLTEEELDKYRFWDDFEWGSFAHTDPSYFVVSPNGKVWKFVSFLHNNTFVYEVTLKSATPKGFI